MSTLRISNIEAKSVPASATTDEKIKITNSSGDVLVFLDGKTSGITTVGINTTDPNITFDANSNVVVTGIITATKFVGTIEPTDLTVSGQINVGSNIKLGNAGVITATSFVGSGANLTSLPAQATIANNADDRVITGGSGVNLNGEANLTFETSTSGGTLTVAGTSEYQIKLKDTNNTGNAAETALAFTDSGDTVQGFVGFNYWGDGNLDIQNNNSGQSICFNTGGGNERFRVKTDGIKVTSVNAHGSAIQMYNTDSSSNVWYVNGEGDYFTGNSYPRSDANKDLGFHSGHRWRDVVLSGGIRFGSANSGDYLDDYEEGSFTATLSASGGGATFASGHIQTACLYVKIGSMVHIQGYFSGTNVTGGGTGIVKVSGLPFASNNTTYYTICLTHNTMTAQACTGAYIQYANTYFFPIQSGATSGSAFNVGNPRYMMFGGSYPVQF
jgi:hypothetical protein